MPWYFIPSLVALRYRGAAASRKTFGSALGFVVLALGFLETAWADDPPILANLTFEQLSQIEITTVSRTPEALWKTPASVTVVTHEDIDRSGATSLPEVLRWVPGLNVAQINANAWAIGARGFQWQYANKLLVMIDGRSIYSPANGGVRWEENTIFLEDLARIEVVRGPGSSVWGANAVNGVVNVVTRNAFDTLGTHVYAAGGNEQQAVGGIRHGWKLSDQAAIRFYAMYRLLDDNVLPSGLSGADGAQFGQSGFRLDWKPSATDTVTVQGHYFASNTDYQRTFTTLTAPPTYKLLSTTPIRSRGANVLGRWRHDWGESSYFEWKNYWDWVDRRRPQDTVIQHTFDSDFVAGTHLSPQQELTAGMGYRFVQGQQKAGLYVYQQPTLNTRLFSAFIQDQITLVPDRWALTLGTKVEHNNFTGWEPQPTVRLAYTPSSETLLWAAVGRAVRTPTWSEENSMLDARVFPPGVFDPALPATIRILGNPALKAEKLTSYEMGARWTTSRQLSLEFSGFYYDYADYVLATYTSVTTQSSPPALIRAAQYQNGIMGESYGGELSLRWQAAEWCQFLASYSYTQIQLHTRLSDPFGYEQDEDTTPDHTLRLQSSLRINPQWTLNLAGRYVDSVPYYGVPSYVEMDANLAWKPTPRWQVSLAGRNLLHSQHPEYDSALSRRLTEIQRSVFLVAKWEY